LSAYFFETIKEVLHDLGTGVFYEEAFKRLVKKGIEINYSTTGGLPWIEIDTPQDLRIAKVDIAPKIRDIGGKLI